MSLDIKPVLIFADGAPVSSLNPLQSEMVGLSSTGGGTYVPVRAGDSYRISTFHHAQHHPTCHNSHYRS